MNEIENKTDIKRILIVGGSGFLGRHLITKLLSMGYSVRCLDRKKPDWLSADVEFYEGDFTAMHQMGVVLDGCDVVYHLASTVLPKSSNDDPQFDISSNLLGTVGLMEQSVKAKVKKFIFISSGGTVYGQTKQIPVPETHQTNPLCSYGIVKLTIEKYIQLFNQMYGFNACALRLANPYGAYQRVDAAQGAVAVFCDKALRGETIDIWGDGSIIRDFIYIDDVIDAFIKTLLSDCAGKVINIGHGSGTSLNQLLSVIEEALGFKIKKNYQSFRGFDVPEIYLDISQAKEILRWSPKVSLRQGIESLIEWMKKQ